MKTRLLIYGFLIMFSTIGFGQNVNMVIQVNDKLVYDELSQVYLLFGSGDNEKKIPIGYVPGDLILDENIWTVINSDTLDKFSLHFDYNSIADDKHEIASFYVDLNKQKLKQQYLILNIYDFRDKKFRHWYKWLTDKEFLAELRFPNSGIFIRQK